MKAQKDKQETMKAQQPSQGRRNWKADNLSSVVVHQSGKHPSAHLRETQLRVQMKGDWKLSSCWEVQTQFRGFLWVPDRPWSTGSLQAGPTPSLWLYCGEGDKGLTRWVLPVRFLHRLASMRSERAQRLCLTLGSHTRPGRRNGIFTAPSCFPQILLWIRPSGSKGAAGRQLSPEGWYGSCHHGVQT